MIQIDKTFDCCDPWFTHIKEQRKIVEGRLNSAKYSDLLIGNIIKLIKEDDFILLKVTNVTKYKSFSEMLQTETLARVLPDSNINTIDDGVNVYRQFYSEKSESKKGVIAITIEVIQ